MENGMIYEGKEFFAIGPVGLVCLSICAPQEATKEEIEGCANFHSPTGISSKWEIADEDFANGMANGCQCDKDANRNHWLLQC